MKELHTLLCHLVQKSPTKANWKLYLIQNWAEIMGSLHQRVSLEQVYEQNVVLGVHDSSWMQELYLMSRLIIQKINSTLDQPRITSVRFKATGIKKERIQKQIHVPTQQTPLVLTTKEQKALNAIQDPLLRQALEELYKKCQH